MNDVVSKTVLISRQFRDDVRLQRCLRSAPDHVLPGSRGEHVGRIQGALIKLGVAVIGATEIASQFYGPDTAKAVLLYKGPPRNVVNKRYQDAPDNIVGQMTIDRLDDEMDALEKKPDPNPPLTSRLVSLTMAGSPHDHSKCPRSAFPGPDGLAQHLGTPINPQGFGLKINIGGEGETQYLGFQDFTTDPISAGPKNRPFTQSLPDSCASDICLRDSPISDAGAVEIPRIAMSFCRLTVSTSSFFLPGMLDITRDMGVIIEQDSLVDFDSADGLGKQIFVMTMKEKPARRR